MGFQSSVNNIIGTVAGLKVAKGLGDKIENNTKTVENNTKTVQQTGEKMQAQQAELMRPDKGQTLLNTLAEREALNKLADAKYGQRYAKGWYQLNADRIENAKMANEERMTNALEEYNSYGKGVKVAKTLSQDTPESEAMADALAAEYEGGKK